jgi:serine protease Do
MKWSQLIFSLFLAWAVWVPGLVRGATLSHSTNAIADVRVDATVRAVQKAMPCVVNIATETLVETRTPNDAFFEQFFGYGRRTQERRYSVGSGIIIDEGGYILTNDHVVSRANRIWVKLSDEAGGGEYEAIRITSTSRSDVAILKIVAKGNEKFQAIEFARDDDLLLGESVVALGNPFGLGGSVSKGILSSKSRRPATADQQLDVLDWLQTDAAINPGNSGGPLVNMNGELIGMNVAVYSEGQGIGFAIPIKRVGESMAEQLTPETLRSQWFGARVKPGSIPLILATVQPESPAYKAGLREGDVVLRINGKTARSFIEYTRELLNSTVAKPVNLQVRQGEMTRDITVHLVPESSYFNADLVAKRTGLTLRELTPEETKGQRLPFSGFVVTEVDKESPLSDVLQKAAVLVQGVDGQAMTNMVRFARLIQAKPTGDKLGLNCLLIPRQGFPQSGTLEITLR